MTVDQFKKSAHQASPPGGLSPLLLALWHDARADWDTAHRLAQDIDDENGAWVHAYLHRKEGDNANAGYWYRRAGRSPARGTLDDEWATIVAALLKQV